MNFFIANRFSKFRLKKIGFALLVILVNDCDFSRASGAGASAEVVQNLPRVVGSSSGGADAILPREHLQPPHFAKHGINQLASIHFEGKQHEGLVFPRPNADDFTIAIVFQSTEGGGSGFTSGSALAQGNGHGGDNDFGISLNSNGEGLAGTGNPDVSLASHPHLNDGRPHLVIFTRVKANGGLTLFVDGTQVDQSYSSNFTGLTSSAQLGIGATPRGDASFTGDIATYLHSPTQTCKIWNTR